MQNCSQALDYIRGTFNDGHGEYTKQETPGFCVRSTDNEYDSDNLTRMYETSDSVYQCAVACNADETCVAFDYQTSTGYCYGYKQDPLASYVGSVTNDWSCYTHVRIPDTCSSIYQETIDSVANIFLLTYGMSIQMTAM
jgi:hypothetical protein